MRMSGSHINLDAPFVEGESSAPVDHLPINENLTKEIEKVLSILTKHEREVVELYFGININYSHTLEEIGVKLNLSRKRVRQIKEKAIRRLRHATHSELLKTYLG